MAKSQQPAITMTTARAIGSGFIFYLSTDPATIVQVDFGDGIKVDKTIGVVSGTLTGSQTIKIYGTGITRFLCTYEQLTVLDVTKATTLSQLTCFQNELTTLDVTKNIVLTDLHCDSNRLSTLDISHNINLSDLSCRSNQIGTLDLTKNTALTRLDCNTNKIKALDVTSCAVLKYIDCEYNQLTFATLPLKNSTLTTYSYWPQKAISIPKNINLGNELDLSDQYSINGNTTVYTWYTEKGAVLVENTDYTITNGKTTFLKLPSDSVFCKMTNATFPDFASPYLLRTTRTKVLIVPKQPQTVTFNPLPDKYVTDPPFSITASASSNLPITYTSSDALVASISGTTVTIHKAGSITITATQIGDNTWEQATASQTLVINSQTPQNYSWAQQASGTTNHLWSVYFTDATTGYAVGSKGTIIKTTDGGTKWFSQTSGTDYQLTSVYFINSTTGWVVGTNCTILRTVNGGTTWTAQRSGLGNDHFFSVCFADTYTGYAVTQTGSIIKTMDGGVTWANQRSEMNPFLFSVYFNDANVVYAVGGCGSAGSTPYAMKVLKTTNGGSTWSLLTNGIADGVLRSVRFINSDLGYAVGSKSSGLSAILKTADGGTTWTSQTLPNTYCLRSVCFTDANTWFCSGDAGITIQTSDGGITWLDISEPNAMKDKQGLYSIYFVNSKLGWVVGSNGTILKYSGTSNP